MGRGGRGLGCVSLVVSARFGGGGGAFLCCSSGEFVLGEDINSSGRALKVPESSAGFKGGAGGGPLVDI
jgi:hypothetical protein